MCVCTTHAAQRSEWYECAWNTKWRRVKIEFPSDLDQSLDFEKRSHRESMGYCQEENEKQETKRCRWSEGHCQRNLGFHITSAVPQTDHLHATPDWGSNESKRSPYQVLSTYTVHLHTFQKANNSLKTFLLVLWNILICWDFDNLWISGLLLNVSQNLYN